MSVHFGIAYDFHRESFDPLIPVFAGHGVTAAYDYHGQDIALLADAGCRGMTAASQVYNLNHGIGCKNQFWVGVERDRGLTHFVPSKYFQDRYRGWGIEAEVTGIPSLDPAFKARSELGEKKDGFHIVYAPTCHPEISSMSAIGGRIYELENEGGLHVKLHPEVHQHEDIGMLKRVFPRRETAHFSHYLKFCDVAIGDYSSIPISSTICGVPAIIFETTGYRDTRHFSPENTEVKFSDACYKATDFDQVLELVRMLKKGEDPLKKKRKEVSELLCEFQGTASERVFEVLNGRHNLSRR